MLDLEERQGFTLIEILVVMLIIGIVTSVVVLSTGNFYLAGNHPNTAAYQLANMISLAHDQAIFSSNTLGLQIGGGGYQFLQLNDNNNILTWKPLGQSDPFWGEQNISSDILVRVNTMANINENAFRQGDFAPQIILYPSGEMTPFTIGLQKGSSVYTVSGSATGTIKVAP